MDRSRPHLAIIPAQRTYKVDTDHSTTLLESSFKDAHVDRFSSRAEETFEVLPMSHVLGLANESEDDYGVCPGEPGSSKTHDGGSDKGNQTK